MDARLVHWPDSERMACVERALLPGSAFEAAFRLMPAGLAGEALATEALYRSVTDVPRQTRDPGVAVAKLAWWQSAIPKALRDGSQHPVIAMALRYHLPQSMPEDGWSRFVQAVASRVEEDTPGSEMRWLDRFEAVEGGRGLLACGVNADHPAADALRGSAAAAVVLETLLRACPADAPLAGLPLDLVARFQLQPGMDDHSRRNQAIAHLASAALERWSSGPGPEPAGGVHGSAWAIQCVVTSVVIHRLRALANRRDGDGRMPRPGWRELFTTWNTARRFAARYSEAAPLEEFQP